MKDVKKIEKLNSCDICPHKCKVNRNNNQLGRCRSNYNVKVALVSSHMYEEPCISGTNGSGTVFFSNCNLNCKFCQNYEISQKGKGKEITIEKLAEIFIEQQKKNVHNINLVTPTIYVEQIKLAIDIAKKEGLNIPIIYNSNGYENIETIKSLKGYIDVYLPDLKYSNNEIAKKYSNINSYFEVATEAIKEMYNQVGMVEFDEDGMIKKGVIIRHLILPNYILNTKNVIKWIKENMPNDIYVSIMSQYFPTYLAKEEKFLNRKITRKEYKEIKKYLELLQLENGYIQEFQANDNEEVYVPNF